MVGIHILFILVVLKKIEDNTYFVGQVKMSFIMEPINRTTLQGLKAKRDKWVRTTVELIYTYVISTAEEGRHTSYRFVLIKPNGVGILQNIIELLCRLKSLFPDCAVSHQIMGMLRDGTFCDIKTVKGSDLNPGWERHIHEYIVVDWA